MKRWTVWDRNGNEVYLTNERWEHILDGHPEMENVEDALRETLRSGTRRQDNASPQKYRYRMPWPGLAGRNTHVEAVVLFRFEEDEQGRAVPNNYVVTAYPKMIR